MSLPSVLRDRLRLPLIGSPLFSFGSGGNQKSKAWRDIWGCGQGGGAVKSVPTVAELVARLSGEYERAKSELAPKMAFTAGKALMAAA
jgi:nitronate monooxygenase